MNPEDVKWDMPAWDRDREERVFERVMRRRSARLSRRKSMRLTASALIAVGASLLLLRPIGAQPEGAGLDEAPTLDEQATTTELAMQDSGNRND